MSRHRPTLAIYFCIALSSQLAVADDTVDQKLNVAANLFKAEAYPEVITVLDGVVSNSTATVRQKASAYAIRGDAYVRLEKLRDAYSNYASAIAQQEKLTDGEDYLAKLLNVSASLADSFQEYNVSAKYRSRAVRLTPNDPLMSNNLAWFLATCPDESFHDGILAVHYATRACTLTKFDNPGYLETLASTFARAGRYDLAVSYQEQAIGHPKVLEQFTPQDLKQFARRLQSYKDREPFVVSRPSANNDD